MTDPDIVFITVDSWRYDAPRRTDWTPTFASAQTDALCHHESTGGVFPTIFNSVYASEYSKDVTTHASLPRCLSNSGYTSGGFVAGNPFCNQWSSDFDTFWNAGYKQQSGLAPLPVRAADYFYHLATLRPEVPAEEVIDRTRTWFQNATRPRFCWLHLMEPHEPYHPGFSQAHEIGILRSYAALIQFKKTSYRTDDTLPAWVTDQAEQLYWASVRQLHNQIDDLLDWVPSDATVVLTGDHGEEFDHGVYHHARLYDEVIRVPFYTRWTLDETQFNERPIRQLDIAPTIVDSVRQEIPKGWRGVPYSETENQVTYATSNPDVSSKTYAARREGRKKLLYEFNSDGELIQQEVYDIKTDPTETTPLSADNVSEDTHRDLKSHLEQYGSSTKGVVSSNIGPNARNRLENLGYR